jgi:hypothetical protein
VNWLSEAVIKGSVDKWGGGNFISFCTAINLAAVSWDKFQSTLKKASERADEITNSISANIEDTNDSAIFKRIMRMVRVVADSVSAIVSLLCYSLAAIAFVAGLILLYFDCTCKYAFLLVVPSIFYLVFMWIRLGVFELIAWLMEKLVKKTSAPSEDALAELANIDLPVAIALESESAQIVPPNNQTLPTVAPISKRTRRNGSKKSQN